MRYLPIEEPILKDLETRFGYRRAILPPETFSAWKRTPRASISRTGCCSRAMTFPRI